MGAEDDDSAALIAKMLAKDERAMQADTAPVGKKHKGKRRGSDDDVRRPSSIQVRVWRWRERCYAEAS